MKTSNVPISAELRALFLENKDTSSDISFPEDESKYFEKLEQSLITHDDIPVS